MHKTILFVFIIISVLFILIEGCTSNNLIPKYNIDYSCDMDADCEIKNVGNYCGYDPLCVNKNFSPNPPELSSAVCGFADIDWCECVENKCKGFQKVPDIKPWSGNLCEERINVYVEINKCTNSHGETIYKAFQPCRECGQDYYNEEKQLIDSCTGKPESDKGKDFCLAIDEISCASQENIKDTICTST